MPQHDIGVSVIIPAFNEEKGLERALRQTRANFRDLGVDAEFIVVNDCSGDGTGTIAERLAGEFGDVRTFHHRVNQGAGQAFKTGIEKATKEFVMFVPVDNPLEPEDLEAYLPRLPICDVVVGVRVERVGYPPLARFASFAYNRILVPLLFNLGIADVNWIQAYRRSLFSEGTLGFENTRIFFLVEILVRARLNRLIVSEVPARMRKRLHGRPTCFKAGVIFKTFFEMLDFWYRVYLKEPRV